jgi:hypothetical protein
VFRALVAVSSAVALQLGALGAPLVHAHLDDHDHDHHGAARVHAHLGGHATPHHVRDHDDDHLAFDEDESSERATGLQLFVAVESPPFSVPLLPPARYALPAPLQSIMRRPPAVTHSHDPPGVRPSAPRAPPSFPS